jgi:hypothetical protein
VQVHDIAAKVDTGAGAEVGAGEGIVARTGT